MYKKMLYAVIAITFLLVSGNLLAQKMEKGKPLSTTEMKPIVRYDLAADIKCTVVSKDSTGNSGQIKITGIVKNVGGGNWEYPALAVLEERIPGAAPRSLDQKSITSLRQGQTIELVHSCDWTPSAESEFPPTFVTYISYDPDTLSKDTNSGNNFKELTGQEINKIFESALVPVSGVRR